MPDEKKTTAPKASAKLAPASESSDAAVHNLLAHRDIAVRNDDQDAIKEVDRQLADLGVEAG